MPELYTRKVWGDGSASYRPAPVAYTGDLRPVPAWFRVMRNPISSRRARRAAIQAGRTALDTMEEILDDEVATAALAALAGETK